MRFDPSSIFQRYEFNWDLYPWGVCRLLSQFFRLCLNTFVLSLALTFIDLYFNKSTSTQVGELVKINAIVAAAGLVSMRAIFVVLNNMFAMVLLSVIFSRNNYEGYIKIFALLASVCIVYFVKNRFISEAGLIFSYPVAVLLLEVFMVISLRSSINSYGIRCSR